MEAQRLVVLQSGVSTVRQVPRNDSTQDPPQIKIAEHSAQHTDKDNVIVIAPMSAGSES